MRYGLLFILVLILGACGTPAEGVSSTALPALAQIAAPTHTPLDADSASSISTATSPVQGTGHTQATVESNPPIAPTPGNTFGAGEFPDSSAYTWQFVVDGLDSPVGLTHAGDGSGRLFIVEQVGRVRIFQDGSLLPTPFLDIRERVGSRANEQGLLGLAFHPRFSENGYFFVNYTDLNGDTVIARYRVSSDNPDLADAASETQLLGVSQPFGNHNGGMLAFGPDGCLYAGLGDGGSAGDPMNNGQSLNTLLGKILRIDVDGAQPYTIPPDNPYIGRGLPEIWASGLRNPWRFSFDRLTGDLYIGDVGQNQWEEINFLPSNGSGGANFGWRIYEGKHVFQGSPPSEVDFVEPIAEYGHDQGYSVTGGFVYRGENLPEWQGIYLYGDYGSGHVWGLKQKAGENWESRLLFESAGRITTFGEDEAGEIYLVDQGGAIYILEAR